MAKKTFNISWKQLILFLLLAFIGWQLYKPKPSSVTTEERIVLYNKGAHKIPLRPYEELPHWIKPKGVKYTIKASNDDFKIVTPMGDVIQGWRKDLYPTNGAFKIMAGRAPLPHLEIVIE